MDVDDIDEDPLKIGLAEKGEEASREQDEEFLLSLDQLGG